MIGALALQFSVLLAALGLMQWSLRRWPGTSLFAALPLGVLPSLAMSVLFFVQVHGQPTPELTLVKGDWMARWAELWTARASKAPNLSEAHKAEFMALGEQLFGTMPALYFSFQLAVLAAAAAWLRQRLARLALAPRPEPLARWMAPLGLIWLVLGPVFWVFGGQKGVVQGPAWAQSLAVNLLIVGCAVYVFQGAVIMGAKMAAWSREPGTRALTPLVLAAVVGSLLLLNGQGLLVFLVLTGLFDPWIDLRRLQAKPEDGKTAS